MGSVKSTAEELKDVGAAASVGIGQCLIALGFQGRALDQKEEQRKQIITWHVMEAVFLDDRNRKTLLGCLSFQFLNVHLFTCCVLSCFWTVVLLVLLYSIYHIS